GGVSRGRGRFRCDFGLHRWSHQRTELRGRVLWRDRPRRGGCGRVRPAEGLLRGASCGLLAEPRSNAAKQAGMGRGHPVPLCDLLPHPRAGSRRQRLEGEGPGALQETHRHRDNASLRVLPGRGIPSTLLREEQAGPLLLAL
ncbi:Peptide-methionine (S)-S-oxide reductase MsrA, partial [uncultured Rubrobacteraceae bacterium]